jgi:hypothetical protein
MLENVEQICDIKKQPIDKQRKCHILKNALCAYTGEGKMALESARALETMGASSEDYFIAMFNAYLTLKDFINAKFYALLMPTDSPYTPLLKAEYAKATKDYSTAIKEFGKLTLQAEEAEEVENLSPVTIISVVECHVRSWDQQYRKYDIDSLFTAMGKLNSVIDIYRRDSNPTIISLYLWRAIICAKALNYLEKVKLKPTNFKQSVNDNKNHYEIHMNTLAENISNYRRIITFDLDNICHAFKLDHLRNEVLMIIYNESLRNTCTPQSLQHNINALRSNQTISS